jgi:DNA-binding NtrC family response regulator
MSSILIIDDDLASCRTLELHFRSQGHQIATAHSAEEGLATAARQAPELIILDIRLPGRSGLQALPDFKETCPGARIIMITAFHDMDSTIQAMQRGADDYIQKPIDINELDDAVTKALRYARATEESLVIAANPETSGLTDGVIVGRSRVMKEVFKTIGLVAPSLATVLITGESGTGKELVARAIHRAGLNPAGPFIAINCAALVENLLESEMFGHEKGAFTGALARHPGKFAVANNGTIFLDEVGELSPTIQAKLLRVLQEKEYVPVGGQAPQVTNARIIAATNVDLLERMKSGAFREDLYYRLQVVNIQLPPLRERKGDIPDLVQALLVRINREMRRSVTRVHQEVLRCFEAYDWPGNVRELENVLMKAVALSPTGIITVDQLPPFLGQPSAQAEVAGKPLAQQSLREMAKAHVRRVLEETGWHRGHACEILGVSRPRLRRMIRQFGLTPLLEVSLDPYEGEEDGAAEDDYSG